MHFYYEKKNIQHLHCPCVYVQLERLRKMSLLWPCCSPMVPLLIVLNFRTPPFSEHDWMKIYPELVPYCRLHEISYSCRIGNWVDVGEEWVVCMGQFFNPYSNPLSDLYLCDDCNENKMSVLLMSRIHPSQSHGLITKRQCELYSAYSLFIHCLDWKFFLMLYSASIYILSFFVPIVNIPMYNCTVLM